MTDSSVIGIDFGTTSSVAAIIAEEGPRVLVECPSVVSLLSDGQMIAGQRVKGAICIESVKRFIGRDAGEALPLLRHTELAFIRSDSSNSVLRAGSLEIAPFELASRILEFIKLEAQKKLKVPISSAVLTVPAYFDNRARREIFLAAKAAGIELLRVVSEPTAAAYAYGLQASNEGTYMVYDLGGGTFDVSILSMREGVFKVIGVDGDNALGGDDLDFAIAKWITSQVSEASCIAFQDILSAARNAKESLYKEQQIEIVLGAVCNRSIKTEFTASILNSLASPLANKSVVIAQRLFERCSSPKLDGILLVGGSTKLGIFEDYVSRAFSGVPIMGSIDPERIVAFGAAWQAHNLSRRVGDVLIDVVPLSLGLELADGLVDVLIHRNSSIPTRATRTFTTGLDGQTSMEFNVIQGERERALDCISLARFGLNELPPRPKGSVKVEVTFALDANGILSVQAKETTTQSFQEITVHASYGLSGAELNRILTDSIEHAKEDFNLRMLLELKRKAEALLEGIYKIAPFDRLQKIDSSLAEQALVLENALKGSDIEQIEHALVAVQQSSIEFFRQALNEGLRQKLVGRKIEDLN